MDPSTKKKPKPTIAVIAIVVPLLAIVAVALVSGAGVGDRASTETTISQVGDPDAPAESGGDTGSAPSGDGTAAIATDGEAAAGEPAAAAEDVPTRPRDAGAEGDRTTVTYPQPTVPDGGCTRPSGAVVITLGSAPDPVCLELGVDQPVTVRNRTGKEISFVSISVNEVIPAGEDLSIGPAGSAFGEGRSSFWSPGNPQLSGIVVVG